MEATMVEQALIEPRMLQQGNCITTGDSISCPTQADFTFDGNVQRITADIACPLTATAQSDFRQATQDGLCECSASLQDLNNINSSPVPLDCNCFICPDEANLFGVAFECSSAIVGPCSTFNCQGICNGDLDFLYNATNAPTSIPDEGDCSILGGSISCPTQADFTFDGSNQRITADIVCPLSAIEPSDFQQATQNGLCECSASLQDLDNVNSSPVPLDCNCFICPDEANLFGVAFECSSAIIGPCSTFNCQGICNGDLDFLYNATTSITSTPIEGGDYVNYTTNTPTGAPSADYNATTTPTPITMPSADGAPSADYNATTTPTPIVGVEEDGDSSNSIDKVTNAPTPAAVGGGEGLDSAAIIPTPNLATAALLILTLLRMFR